AEKSHFALGAPLAFFAHFVLSRSPAGKSSRAGFHAEQFSDGPATHYLKARALEHRDHSRLAEKINRAAAQPPQPHFADRHAPGPEARPRGKKSLPGEIADQAEAFGRILDIVPEA